jgi:S-DNA-T family DNA segregation ATPase FtsK/SpoIIIE
MALPANTRVPTVLGRGAGAYGRKHEVAALVLWTLAVFLALALASYRGDPTGIGSSTTTLPGADWVGFAGNLVARKLVTLVGVVAWALPLELALLGIPLIRGTQSPVTPARVAGDLLIVVVATALVQVGSPDRTAFGDHPAGGLLGEVFGELARSLFSTAGSFLLGLACLGLILIGRAAFSFIALARLVARMVGRACNWVARAARAVARAWRQAKQLEMERQDIARLANEPRIDMSPRDEAIIAALSLDTDGGADTAAESATVGEDTAAPKLPVAEAGPAFDAPKPAPQRRSRKTTPTIVDTSAALERERATARDEADKRSPTAFKLPSAELLVAETADPIVAIDRDKLLANAQKLVETLAHYGVQGKVEDILPGPTVTTYEVSPAVGTKVSKVAGLADDLALALARKVRIVAPIPGKNRVGFELPNERRVRVVLRELIEDRRFQSLAVPLPVVLGRDILGNPVYADLGSTPHVIVAGATGSGKSVGLNVMLLSLLYRRAPDELRLLMIDPKVVELAPFDRIPHMLLPVVTDMKQAATALKWAVDEMERRYQLFADAGTKNVATYNSWVTRTSRLPASDAEGLPPEKLPWIVIVVDEFADLMMQQGKEVEAAVARLAQKARAAGMHVILATQRPSTDVITGTIKANFPTRIAYRVAQKVDSRTILDEQGAEHLLGMGDMLIKLNGTGETKRVQCPWVSEEEVQLVTEFLRTQGEPVYDANILKPREDESAAEEADAEQDPLYDDAVRLVADTRRCSTSWLQRKLGLGYNRAARIVETMERRGLVGPANGAKDRDVLIDSL